MAAAYRAERLRPSGKGRVDPDSGSLATDKPTSDGLRYTVESSLPRLTADELAGATGPVPNDITDRYLELPAKLPTGGRVAAQKAGGAETTPYRRAKALQDWFRPNFPYNLQVPAGH